MFLVAVKNFHKAIRDHAVIPFNGIVRDFNEKAGVLRLELEYFII